MKPGQYSFQRGDFSNILTCYIQILTEHFYLDTSLRQFKHNILKTKFIIFSLFLSQPLYYFPFLLSFVPTAPQATALFLCILSVHYLLLHNKYLKIVA